MQGRVYLSCVYVSLATMTEFLTGGTAVSPYSAYIRCVPMMYRAGNTAGAAVWSICVTTKEVIYSVLERA